MDEAQHLADRLVILRAGDVVGSGTTAELSAGDGDTAMVTFLLEHHSTGLSAEDVGVLAVWGMVAAVVAVRTFRWEPQGR